MVRTYPSAALGDVDRLVPEWSTAANESKASLYMTPEWVLSLWESHFGRSGVEFVVAKHNHRLQSVFPLYTRTLRKLGVSITQVELLTNNYGQNHNELACFPMDSTAVAGFWDAIGGSHWDVAYIASVPNESPTMRLVLASAAALGHLVTLETNVASPYLMLPADWDSFLASKSANFRADMRRKWTKAVAAGLQVQLVTDVPTARDALTAILQIEANSWKEGEGTSISAQELPLRFYQAFLPRAAEKGWLRIYLVFLDGRPIAYDMGVLLRSKYYMLKTSFVDEFAKLSPGVYLRQYVIKDLLELGGVTEHDFLGGAEPYKLRWTTEMRPHSNLFVYNRRSVKALALYQAKRIRTQLKSKAAALLAHARTSAVGRDS